MKPKVTIEKGKTKQGRDYEFVQVTIGEYQARLFPTKGELGYLHLLAQKEAHKEFQDEDLDEYSDD